MPATGHRVRRLLIQHSLYGPRGSVILRSRFPEPAGTGRSNQEALTETLDGLLIFEAQIPALHNKSEVALHPLSGELSEQTALHHVGNRRNQNYYHPMPISITHK